MVNLATYEKVLEFIKSKKTTYYTELYQLGTGQSKINRNSLIAILDKLIEQKLVKVTDEEGRKVIRFTG